MEKQKIESNIQDVNTEMMVVGMCYENPDLLHKYGKWIEPELDFYHDTARFLYNAIYELVQLHPMKKIDEGKVHNFFMNQDEERKQKYAKLGGYNYIKRIMNLVDTNDFQRYYDILKECTLLRELEVTVEQNNNLLKKLKSQLASKI